MKIIRLKGKYDLRATVGALILRATSCSGDAARGGSCRGEGGGGKSKGNGKEKREKKEWERKKE